MRPLMPALFIALVSQLALAEEPSRSHYLLPMAPFSDSKSTVSLEQLDHLRAAAKHLIQAGMKQEAEKLGEKIAAIEHNQAVSLLAMKEKELDLLQAEIEQLRKVVRPRTMISLSFHVVDVSPAKLKSASLGDFEVLFPTTDGKNGGFAVLKDPSQVEDAIDRLRKRGLIKVLAAPTMATTSGQTLSFNAGSEVGVGGVSEKGQRIVKIVQVGTKIEAQPTLMDNGKLRLALYLRVTDQNDGADGAAKSETIPSFHVRDLETAVDMEFNRVCMLRGLKRQKIQPQPDPNANASDIADDIETVVLITPKRLDSAESVAHRPIRASYVPATKAAAVPNPLDFGGVTPHVINQEEEEEERLIKQ
jgi:hypothetical protein